MPIANEATFPTLDADRIVYRLYQRTGQRTIFFSLVGSTKGQSLHHPLICYQFAGWPTEDRGTTTVPVGDGDVVLRYVIGRDPRGPTQVDLHWFLWPTPGRGWDDGVTQARVTALVTVTEEHALADARAFAAQLFAQARRPDAIDLTPTPRPTSTAPIDDRLPSEPLASTDDKLPSEPLSAEPDRLPSPSPAEDAIPSPIAVEDAIPAPARSAEPEPSEASGAVDTRAPPVFPPSTPSVAAPPTPAAPTLPTAPVGGLRLTPLPLPRPPVLAPPAR